MGGNPSPLTLRHLARGLASDGFAVNGFDPVRADAFYRQLMDAAGYLGGLPLDAAPRQTGTDDVVQFLTEASGDSVVSEQLIGLAQRYPDLDPTDQMLIRRLLATWVKAEAV